jgi:signal transduction histidine kinase
MMKSLLQSLTGRVVVILVCGVILSALLAFSLTVGERQRMIGQFRDFHAVERVAQFVLSVEGIPPELRVPYLAAARGVGVRAQMAEPSESMQQHQSDLAERLAKRLPAGHQVVSTEAHPDDCVPPKGPPPPSAYAHPSDFRLPCEALLVTLQDGTRLRIAATPPRPISFAAPRDLLTYGALFILCVGALAAVVARMALRPLNRLAQAATELGNDIERPPLPEQGATEIRQAAAAFNAMQLRIRHHIRQRSHIMAAITHDLQTPLTRLRLRLEKVDDDDLRTKLLSDLSAMQTMVREGLDLARSLDSTETPQRLDLDSLIDSVTADASDAGQAATAQANTSASVMARPVALRRCLTNLLDNAVKYGRQAKVSAALEGGFAVIRIRDDGPGIPEDETEKVFDPFYRLETSRSRDTGGTGLGLTIARNIAEQHGGTLKLRNHPGGGLEVVLRLPIIQKSRGDS